MTGKILVPVFLNTVANSVQLRIFRPYEYGAERAEIVTLEKAGVQKSRFQPVGIPAFAAITERSLSAVIGTSGTDGWRKSATAYRKFSTNVGSGRSHGIDPSLWKPVFPEARP